MLALVYLFIVFLLGDAICRRFFAFVSTPHRLAAAFLSGLLISSWWTYLAAVLFTETSRPMLWGNLVFFVTAIGAVVLLRRLPIKHVPTTEIDPESTKFRKWDWIATIIFFAFACWLMFSTFTMSDGNLRIANHQSSDFGSTVSIMQTFAQGHNFPTEYPHFSGDRIRYHFLFYFQAGNLEYLGLNPALSYNILSILSLMSMLILVMTLGAVLFASRVVGRIGAGLFFFHGSLAFIPFLMANNTISAAWTKLSAMRDFLPSGFPYRGEDWGVWSQVVYLNQRHLASSIGIFLIVLVFLAIRYRAKSEIKPAIVTVEADPAETEFDAFAADTEVEDLQSESVSETEVELELEPEVELELEDAQAEIESVDEPPQLEIEPEPVRQPDWVERLSPFVLAGVLLGLLPMWNGAVFTAAAAMLALLFLLLPLRREMLALAVSSAVIALPQVIFLKTDMLRTPEYSFFHWGYTIDDPTFYKVFSYLVFVFGFKWLLIGVALAFGSRLQRLFFLAATALILIALCFQFSEEVLANHKFFNVWLVLMNIPVAFGLVKLWRLIPGEGVIVGRILAVALAILIAIGGVLDLFPIKNSYWVEYKYDGDPLVEWVKANTDPKSIFLSHRYVNHGILLAGRRLFYGHPYYAWGAGYPTSERDGVYRKMFESQNMAEVFGLLKDNRISYVAIDNQVRKGDFIKKSNEKIFEAYFPIVFVDTENKYDSLRIYSVPSELPTPDPSVAAPAMTAVETRASPTANAFTGGVGNAPGQLTKPRRIGADIKGNFYVADWGNSRVQKFDADGKFVLAFGTAEAGEGGLKEPNGVAIDATGNIYVTEVSNHKLAKFGPDGKFIKEWKGPDPGFYGPGDISIGPNKQFYIVDQGRTRIVKFDPTTEAFTAWGTRGVGEGQFIESTGIAIGGGLVFIADNGNNRIQVFDLDGKFVRQWVVTGWESYVWNYPDIAFDEQTKRLYVTNPWKKQVLAFDVDGNPLDAGINTDEADKIENPTSLCIIEANKKRRLLVLNTDGAKVTVFELGTKTGK